MILAHVSLFQAVQSFLSCPHQLDLSCHMLSNDELIVLSDLCQVLEVPHLAQELLSSEQAPTLSLAIPVYKLIISKWKSLQISIPELSPAIQAGIDKLQEYLSIVRQTKIYGLAMGKPFVIEYSSTFSSTLSKLGSTQSNSKIGLDERSLDSRGV
jgi:hypothetical protein